jgi:biopolymer transport protein ExbB/TolQ
VTCDAFALEAAERAAKLGSRGIHFRMSRGLNQLAAIVVTALFVGAFGTCYDVLTSFKGCGCSMEDLRAALSYEYARALVPTAWGFILAVPSMWAHRQLGKRIESFDLEMEAATLEMMNYLSITVGRERSEQSATV